MCHLLVIEDEPLIAAHVGALALEAGATTIAFASNENEAVEQAAELTPQVIVSDVKLTCGTGPGAVRSIVDRHGPIPVLFITGSPEALEDCGCTSLLLTKPFVGGSVIAAIRGLIEA